MRRLFLVLLLACSGGNGGLDGSVSVDAGDGEDAATEDAATEDAADARLDAGVATYALMRIADGVGGAHGFARGPSGDLWIADSHSSLGTPGAVYRWEEPFTGALERTTIEGPRPSGLFFEADGALVVSDPGARTVVRYRDGAEPETIASVDAWNVIPDGSGFIAITFSGSLLRVASGGDVSAIRGGLQNPFDVARDPSGCFWVSEQGPSGEVGGGVRCWSPSGELVREIPYEWVNPEGVAVDVDGGVWIAETARGELLRWDGSAVEVVAADLSVPVVLTNDGEDLLLATVGRPTPTLYQIVRSVR
ncbi:MAG: hypothetical protein AAGE52_00780 [Myxococcota bacterium]